MTHATGSLSAGNVPYPTERGYENFNRGEDKGCRTKTKTEGLAVTTIYGCGRGFDSGRRTADVTGVRRNLRVEFNLILVMLGSAAKFQNLLKQPQSPCVSIIEVQET